MGKLNGGVVVVREGGIGRWFTGEVAAVEMVVLAGSGEDEDGGELLRSQDKINMGKRSWWPRTRGDGDGEERDPREH